MQQLKSVLKVSVYARAAVLFVLVMMIPLGLQAGGTSLVDRGNGILEEQGRGKMWQAQRSRRMRDFGEVEGYLAKLNSGQFSDWRLPTRQELYDFILLFDLHKSGDISIRLEGAYWLTGDNGQPQIGSWEAGDQCGLSRIYYPGLSGHVRAVRP